MKRSSNYSPPTVSTLAIDNAGIANTGQNNTNGSAAHAHHHQFRVSEEEYFNGHEHTRNVNVPITTTASSRHMSIVKSSSRVIRSLCDSCGMNMSSSCRHMCMCQWRTPSKRFVRGIICIVSVCIIWVASSFIVQNLVIEGGLPPLFLTYISNSLFIVLFIPSCATPMYNYIMNNVLNRKRQRHMLTLAVHQHQQPPDIDTSSSSSPVHNHNSNGSSTRLSSVTTHRQKSPRISTTTDMDNHEIGDNWRTYAKAAASVCPIWFLAFYTFNKSLALTNVTVRK